jgi:hypothetical protein
MSVTLKQSFGEWILQDLSSAYYIEKTGWAPERAERAADRLQRDRLPKNRLRVVVFFGSKETAFTAQGPYIFMSRRLLERCRTDAACAWIIAHEIAHHDLDHLARVPDWMLRYAKHRGAWVFATLAQGLAHRVYGPEREVAADRYAVDLCLRAGYHPVDFMGAFDAMEGLVRDVGSQEAIYGPDCALLAELDPRSSVLNRLRIWKWERDYGYYPLRERKGHVEQYLNNVAWADLDLEREVGSVAPESEQDPWKLSSEQRGLFTSPPSAPPGKTFRPTIRIGSKCWVGSPAPKGQVILFGVDDDSDRMLANVHRHPGETFAQSMAAAVGEVHRRWWRGDDENFYLVQTDEERMAVLAMLPEGPWKPDITGLTCLRLPEGIQGNILPWRNLGHASREELEAMRNGETVVAEERQVEVVEGSS